MVSEPDFELDALLHAALGREPRKVWIATNDGGKSCSISDDSRQAIIDCLERYKDGMARGYELGSWDRYPLYSSEASASDALLDEMQKNGWMYVVQSPYGELQSEFMARFVKANDAFQPKWIVGPAGVQDISTDRRYFIGEAHAETRYRAIAIAAFRALTFGEPDGSHEGFMRTGQEAI